MSIQLHGRIALPPAASGATWTMPLIPSVLLSPRLDRQAEMPLRCEQLVRCAQSARPAVVLAGRFRPGTPNCSLKDRVNCGLNRGLVQRAVMLPPLQPAPCYRRADITSTTPVASSVLLVMDGEPCSAPGRVRAWSLASRAQCKRSQPGPPYTRSAVALVFGFAGAALGDYSRPTARSDVRRLR
jgi:hypothetical protein